MTIGKINKVKLREIWRNEAKIFPNDCPGQLRFPLQSN